MNAAYRLPAVLSLFVAVLLMGCAAGGIFLPSVYAHEHPFWAAQGLGQDWVDLVLVAPLMVIVARLTLRRSRVFALLLAGLLVYTTYSLVLYAFFMHFGPLFLFYSWALGLSFYALFGLACALRADDVRGWFAGGAPVRLAGSLAVVVGAMYYLLWLAEVVPALAAGTVLKSATDSGLITNPIHVLDLGIVLPAFIVGGVSLVRGGAMGYWLAPAMLAFGVVMDAALIGVSLSIRATHAGPGGPPLAFLVAMLVLTAGVLTTLLRRAAPPERG